MFQHSLTLGAEALACPDKCSCLLFWGEGLPDTTPTFDETKTPQIMEVLELLASYNTISENYARLLTLRNYLKAYLY